MAPIKFIIVIVSFLLVSIASSIADNLPPANPFSPYLNGKAPEIVKELQPWTLDEKMNVMVRKVVIHARSIPDSKEGDSNVFVIFAKPEKEGKYPGLLFLHGGGGFADETLAKVWAKAGYVVASPDLPGNADPKKVPYSTGPIRLTYDKSRWTANPDVTASSTFDGPVAAVKTFYLLKSQPEVIANKIGVTGVSWGGYMTIMLCGLLGNEIRAAVTVWGAGFYDYGSTFQTALGKMPENERELWLKHLDAGRYAVNIQCAMLFVSATNDKWFYPPCVMKTYDTVKSSKMILWAPNKSHYADNVPGGSKSPKRRSMVGVESDFLDYHLKDEGKPFPKVSIDSVKKTDAGLAITGNLASADTVESVTLWHAAPPADGDWPKVQWQELPCTHAKDGVLTATIPKEALKPSMVFFVTASEQDRSVSSPMWNYPEGWPKCPAEDLQTKTVKD